MMCITLELIDVMKNKFKHILSAILVLFGLPYISLADDCKIAVGYHFEPPILYDDSNTKAMMGLDKEVVDLIAKQAECKVEWVLVPWARALEMMKTGELLMSTNALATEERKKFANMIAYRPDTPNRLFVRKADLTNIKVTSLEDYLNKTKLGIGTALGYQYDDEIEALMKNPKYEARFERIADVQSNINKLMSDRTDGFIMEQLLGNYFIKMNNLEDKISRYDFSFGFDLNRQAYLMISKKADPDNKIADRITKAVEQVKTTDEYKAILKKYF